MKRNLRAVERPFAEFGEAQDPYFEEIDDERFSSNYPMRRLARFFAYLAGGVMLYVGSIVAVYYVTTLLKS